MHDAVQDNPKLFCQGHIVARVIDKNTSQATIAKRGEKRGPRVPYEHPGPLTKPIWCLAEGRAGLHGVEMVR